MASSMLNFREQGILPRVAHRCLPPMRKNADTTVHDEDEESRLSVTSDTSLTTQPYWPTRVFQILFFLLWVTVYLIAIELEFGFVYLVLSALFFIYFNTRTGPKKEGELSAYSVFNPDCEAIEGTLKAEHLEREFNLIQHK